MACGFQLTMSCLPHGDNKQLTVTEFVLPFLKKSEFIPSNLLSMADSLRLR